MTTQTLTKNTAEVKNFTLLNQIEEDKKIQELKERKKLKEKLRRTYYGLILKKLLLKNGTTAYTLAKELNRTVSWINYYLKHLEDLGLIKTQISLYSQKKTKFIFLTEEGLKITKETFRHELNKSFLIKIPLASFIPTHEFDFPKAQAIREDPKKLIQKENFLYLYNVESNKLLAKNNKHLILMEVLDKTMNDLSFLVKPIAVFEVIK